MITNENYLDVLSKKRDYVSVIVFTSKDRRQEIVLYDSPRYNCQNCDELEKGIVSLHDEYYRTEQSKSLKILFAICRFEKGSQMFDYVILLD